MENLVVPLAPVTAEKVTADRQLGPYLQVARSDSSLC